MAVRFRRVIYRLTILLLFAAMMTTGCGGGTGSEFLGKWADNKSKDTIEIARNGDHFLIITSNGQKMGAVYKDGSLLVATAMGTWTITYVKKSDTLIVPGLDGSHEFNKTVQNCPSTQIAALRTLGTEDKQMVLSLTLGDGNNVKYLIKFPIPDTADAATKGGVAKETVPSWELERMGTALSIGDNSLPLGVELRLANKTVQKDTVKQECPSTQIAALRTLGTEDKQMVLSLTLSDGSNVKYLIKLPIPQADRLQATTKEGVAKEKVSSWELERMGLALSIGDNSLPLGVELRLAK